MGLSASFISSHRASRNMGRGAGYLAGGATQHPARPGKKGRWRGMLCLAAVIMPAGIFASLMEWGIVHRFPFMARPVLLGFCAAPFIAQKSLWRHVSDVAQALSHQGLAAGRRAVSHIVGRDVRALDESGVARAAIESLAENFSDGVIAPLFWFLMAGLPGLVVYKAVNTADSMIGHLNDQYRDFGRAAALTDDVMNAIPARLTAILMVLVAGAVRRHAAPCRLRGGMGLAIGPSMPDGRKVRWRGASTSASPDRVAMTAL